jgi:DNA-binding CsgD family transcriptional regulator
VRDVDRFVLALLRQVLGERHGSAIPEEIEAKIVRLDLEGLSRRAIAERTGVHVNTIRGYLRKNRRPIDERRDPRRDTADRVRQMRAEGHDRKAIALALGLDLDTVNHHLANPRRTGRWARWRR